MTLAWKMGFEVELMAPPHRSREDLARVIAQLNGGTVTRFFHPQSEPSKVPGRPSFENLTFGFRASNGEGAPIATFVDDITLQHGLDKARPAGTWYRIVSDDARLLHLVARHCSPTASLATVLEPLASLFGTKIDRHPSGMVKVVDDRNVSIAIGAALPGERERPCEIVTAPLTSQHHETLSQLLGEAQRMGFTIPREGATHIHYDATPLKSAPVIAALIKTLAKHGATLKALVGTNPNCVRLGNWPKPLLKVVSEARFSTLAWPEALAALNTVPLTKYCDFNLINITHEHRTKPTFEVRVLPSSLDPTAIVEAAILFEAILLFAVAASPSFVVPPTTSALIEGLELDGERRGAWLSRLQAQGGR